MKLFISWSGDLSNKVAELLSKWIPMVNNSVQVFFSENDIEKGEPWDKKLSEELLSSNYGIICLTKKNVTAPWIHFEAGALSKLFNISRLWVILIDVNNSDVKGPLSRFQSTKLERDDFLKLITSINHHTEKPREDKAQEYAFDCMWEFLNKGIREIMKNYPSKETKNNQDSPITEAIDEILGIVRKIDSKVSLQYSTDDTQNDNIANKQLSDTYEDLGLKYFELEQRDKALEMFEKSLKVKKRTFEMSHPSISKTQNLIADVNDEIVAF